MTRFILAGFYRGGCCCLPLYTEFCPAIPVFMLYLLLAFLAYLLYKLVFDFIIPVYRATRRIKKQFQDFQNQAGGQQQHTGTVNENMKPGGRSQKPPKKDYIDFEEIK